MKNHNIATTFSAVLYFVCMMNCHAQTGKKLLLALSKADHTLAIVDPATLKVLGRVPVGIDPHEVVASSDGKIAYVAIYGGGTLHEINVIDLVNKKALPTIDTRPLFGPHDVTYVHDKLWFTAEGSKAVGRYNPATSNLDWSMGTGQDRTHMLHVTADARKIYTTNMSSGTVSILSDTVIQPPPNAPATAKPRTDWFQKVIPASVGSEGFDVLPDGSKLWTAASSDGSITVVNLRTKTQEKKIDAKVMGANRLKFTPDGKYAFVSSLSTGDLFIIEVSTQKQIKKLSLGRGAAGILMDTDGTRAFVACSADNYIAVVDLKTFEVTSKLDVGGVPDGMAWSIAK
ncbi:YncE family protein [Chryseolinea sp. T2]|uniref:YncE family protein n=1 Tax=Chryseolinea sp. T2 TaxID=3129255 RepID=UPI003077A1F0